MSNFFSKIGNFFKKLWDVLKKIIVVVLLILAAVLIIWACLATGPLLLFGGALTLTTTMAWVLGMLCVTGAFLIDKEYAGKVVGKVGDAVASAASAVASAAGNVVGSVASAGLDAILSSPVAWIVGGVLLFYFMGKDNRTDSSSKSTEVYDNGGGKSISNEKWRTYSEPLQLANGFVV